jgi:protein gp37
MTAIEWTDVTWNPVRGCSLVSPGCTNCYAMKQAHRFSQPKPNAKTCDYDAPYAGLTKLTNGGPVWTGDVRLVPEKLDEPLRWRKPRRVFVNSMSDLFHEGVPDEFIDAVFGVMASAQRHTFQVLTKRPDRMRAWFQRIATASEPPDLVAQRAAWSGGAREQMARHLHPIKGTFRHQPWPLPNVWLGVSVEDQARADERIPLLLETPAAVRFLSVEPLLGPVDFRKVPGFNRVNLSLRDWWVIVGGESGPGARQCDVAWIRSVVKQCHDAGVPCFVKQLGARPTFDPAPGLGNAGEFIGSGRYRIGGGGARPFLSLASSKGGDPEEWPIDLRVREFPR